MSSEVHGTSSMGGLHDLLDPAFDEEANTTAAGSGEKASSKKRLMNDEEDEDEEIDVEDDSEEEYEYDSPSNNNNNYKPPPITNYSTPSRRRTRSCAVPDVLKTKEVVTLDDLMKHGFLRPGDTLEFSGLGDAIETGILVKDGWIEYGTDKYPDMDAWVIRVFKDHKRRRKTLDCWETVSARHHALSFHRDQFLNKMNNRANYNERKKRLREERKKMTGGKQRHQVPGRSRLVQQESQPIQPKKVENDDEDEDVFIDDEPTTNKEIVLPHKKRKTDYTKHEPANSEKQVSSSSSVDMLGEVPSALLREDTELLPDAYDNLTKAKLASRTSDTDSFSWLGKRKKDDENPTTPPQEKPQKQQTKDSPISRRKTETQAQEMEGDEEEVKIVKAKEEDMDETRDEEKEEKREEKEDDNDETRDEDELDQEQTHDSLAQAVQHDDMPHPPSGKLQAMQHITSASSSSSTTATNASASSSSSEADVHPTQGGKSNFPHTPMDSSDLGTFAARLDEHEKEADLLESLSTKKLSQTKTKQTSPPPAKPTTTPSKPTFTNSKKSPPKPSPSLPPKSTSKPTPSIPPSSFGSVTKVQSTTSSSTSTSSSTPSRPPKFSLPPSSSESVSPIAPTPTPPATPAHTPASSFTTPSSARKTREPAQPAQAVVFTPARPPPSSSSSSLSAPPPSATCKDGKERIILTTGLRSDMLCTLQALITQLGGRMVDDFDDAPGTRVTHVVTGLTAGEDTHRAQRTLKYCCGVLCGAWIVSFEWVLESLAAREWVDESDYELRGDTHGAGAPKKARIALRKGGQRLFTGLRFSFAGDFTQPSRKDLQRVARIGGADLLATLPSPTTTMPEYLEEVKHTHVIIDPERTNAAAAQEIHLVCGLVPLSYHWLLDSVSHYAAQPFDKYRIVVQEEGRGYYTQQSLEF